MLLHLIFIMTVGEDFLIVNLAFGNLKWKLLFKGVNEGQYQIDLDIALTSQIIEHEVVLLKSYLDDLIDSIRVEGFLDPILVTSSNREYVVADGTHRLYALKQIQILDKIDVLHTPVVVLYEGRFDRKAWSMIFEKGIRNLKKIKKEWNLIPITVESEQELWGFFNRGTVSAILCINGEFFLIEEPSESREFFLRNAKKIDSLLGLPDRYTTNSEALKSNLDWAILAPPDDTLGDMKILVERNDLRRRKGSRTIVPIRLMYLPLTIDELKLTKEKAIEKMVMRIDECVERNKIALALPPFRTFAVCRQNWDHYILIMNKDIVFKATPKSALRTIKKKLIPLESVVS
ncbi:MAG: ParB/RepB/Spo0J family partition protein [Candidatus Hodarchaeota archaeon]